MGGLSLPHLIIVALVVLVLFGRGRISDMMGDFGKGIKSFKEGMSDETNRPVTPPPSQIPPRHSSRSRRLLPRLFRLPNRSYNRSFSPVVPPIPSDQQGPIGGA